MKNLFLTMILLLINGMITGDQHHALASTGSQMDLQSWQQPPEISHSSMAVRIGTPAIVEPGQKYPSFIVYPSAGGDLNARIVRKEDNSVDQDFTSNVSAGEEIELIFDGTPDMGRYRIDLIIDYDQGGQLLDSYYFSVLNPGDFPDGQSMAAYRGNDGQLVYTPDYRGNRIPDFSHVGYMGGGVPIPEVPEIMSLEPEPGDDTERIQEALDELGSRPLNESGFRGALLLKRGVYEIGGSLSIRDSGVVLRGEGQGDFKDFWLDPEDGYTLEELKEHLDEKPATTLIATGPEMRRIIDIGGRSGPEIDTDSALEIIDQYVPVGTHSFKTDPGQPELNIGDKIIIERIGNLKWIEEIGMNQIPSRPDGGNTTQWPPSNFRFENEIVEIDKNRIWVKYPIVFAIEKRWGGGRIYKYSDLERISQVGVENLRAISYWKSNENGVDDTRHADRFLDFNNIKNAWVQNLTVEHFYGTNGAFSTGRNSIGITFKDSSTLIADRSFYAGPGYDSSGRTFLETGVYTGRYGWRLQGQGALVKRAYAINNRHAYSLGSRVAGPNVFLDTEAEQSLTWSEPHHRWAVGGLFDNVEESYGISLMNRLWYGSGHGWAGANYVAWNTSGGELVAEQPPTAQNWAIGHVGEKSNGPFHDWNMDMFDYSYGYWESHGTHVEPRSLYLQQLKDRLGPEAPELQSNQNDKF